MVLSKTQILKIQTHHLSRVFFLNPIKRKRRGREQKKIEKQLESDPDQLIKEKPHKTSKTKETIRYTLFQLKNFDLIRKMEIHIDTTVQILSLLLTVKANKFSY